MESKIFLALLAWRTARRSPSSTALPKALLEGAERGVISLLSPSWRFEAAVLKTWECIHDELKMTYLMMWVHNLLQILEYSRKLGRIGDQRNRFLLLSRSWSKWTDYARRVKSFQLLKYLEIEQIASLHWKRITYVRILRAWKDGMGVVRQEKKRMKQRAEAWTKIHSWLDEYEENAGKTFAINSSWSILHRGKNSQYPDRINNFRGTRQNSENCALVQDTEISNFQNSLSFLKKSGTLLTAHYPANTLKEYADEHAVGW